MATRPVVLPETFFREKDWQQWIYHFENVAAVNEWNNEAKLLWLKVLLTGRAQAVFQHFSDETKGMYMAAKEALGKHFESPSRQDRYQAEFQTCRWKKTEGWADFAEEL